MTRMGLFGIAVVGFVLGCSPSPQGSPSAPAPSASQAAAASSAPSTEKPRATTSPQAIGLGERWQRHELPVEVAGQEASPYAAIGGDSGFVVVGMLCAGAECKAAAWASGDGVTWRIATVPGGEETPLTAVGWRGEYLATGRRFDSGAHGKGLVWRSADGLNWSRVGVLDLGACGELCPELSELAVSPDSIAILARSEVKAPALYTSADGRVWNRLNPRRLGGSTYEDFIVLELGSAGSDLVVLVENDGDQQARVLKSDDGQSWTLMATIDARVEYDASFVSDGQSLVLAADVCPTGPCGTQTWISEAGGPFRSSAQLPVGGARIAFADGGYVLVGRHSGEVEIFASQDAVNWEELHTHLDIGDCSLSELAGSRLTVLALVVGPADCEGAWLSR